MKKLVLAIVVFSALWSCIPLSMRERAYWVKRLRDCQEQNDLLQKRLSQDYEIDPFDDEYLDVEPVKCDTLQSY